MLSTIVKYLIDPVTVFLILVGAGLLFKLKKPSSRYWKALFLISAIWFYSMTTPFIPDGMIYLLEKQFDPILVGSHEGSALELQAEEYRGIDIVVLGAGHEWDARLPATSSLEKSALARLAEGIRLYRLIPESRLVFAGYSGDDSFSQAEVYIEAAIELGAELSNRSRYALLPDPTDTWEESGDYKKLILSESGSAAGKEVVVVTSAMHMPRAIGGFRKRGFHPIASPASYQVKKHSTETHPLNFEIADVLPVAKHVEPFKSVIKEYIGHMELFFLVVEGKGNFAKITINRTNERTLYPSKP